eukprot:g26519.t1
MVPFGSLRNAASVGANTVNGPLPFSVFTRSAAFTAVTSVLNEPAETAVSTMSFFFAGVCVNVETAGRDAAVTLTELFESQFRGDIRFRGAAYVEAERVAITRVTAETVFGVVRDGVEYQTQLLRDDEQLKMFCNCTNGEKPTANCKHLWATLLAVEAGGYVPGAVIAGRVPPFIVDEPAFAPGEFVDDWDDDDYEPETVGRSTRRKTAAAETAAPTVPQWELQLQRLRAQMEDADPSVATGGQERQIFYEIDGEESAASEQLVIQVSQRQRRASGQWGKLKPLKLRPGRFDDIEHDDDRTILAYLCGGTPERGNWHSRQAQTQTMVHRFHLPYELCVRVLPLMCETGRVRPLDDGKSSIGWDDGAPWTLSMAIARGDSDDWQLTGRFVRGDASVSIDDADLLLPGGLMLRDNLLSRIEDFDAFEWINQIRRSESLSVPDGEEGQFVDSLLSMPVLPQLDLPDHLKLEEVHCEPVPYLMVKTPSGKRYQSDRLTAEVRFDYQGVLVESGNTGWAIVQREAGRCILRNREFEEAAWTQLRDCGFRRLLDRRRQGHDVEIAARQLGQAVRELVDRDWQVRANDKDVRRPDSVQFRIESGIDWFELHADIDFGGARVAFPELLAALVRGDSTVRMDDGSLGILPEDWARKYGLIGGLGTIEDGHVRFSHHQVALLDALLASQESVDYDKKFAELRDRFHAFEGIVEADEPKDFHGELREYQRQGLGWLEFLQEFSFGGCLADDMGLGKTVQILALLQARRQPAKDKRPSLVVVPKSLLFNWKQECARFAPKLKTLEYTGLDRKVLRKDFKKHDIIFTTYGTMRRDAVELKETPFDYVVLDEAQAIKNSGSQVARASRLLQANHRVALSGTPIENHLGDLWSIFEFLNPGMLGRSSLFKSFATDDGDEEGRRLVARGLRPFILRRTKREVASELPDKFEQTILCDMNAEQRRLYDELREHYRQSLLGMVAEKGINKSKMHVLEALLRLRQAACHPGLLDKSNQDGSSAKFDVLIPQLEELMNEGHKALVFSQFTSLLSILRAQLDKNNVNYEYLDGQSRNRKESVERFQNDPDCGLFLISLKAGGLGLNLTSADYVFLLDPWWNPAVEAQAIDRAHRVGQTRQVFAYRLICRDTVEEKIAELQQKKQSLADAILAADSKSVLKELSKDDLEMLLS